MGISFMNKIIATITTLEYRDNVSLVGFGVGEEYLEMVSLGVSDALKVGSEVVLGVKATNLILSRERLKGVSIANQVSVTVIKVDVGALLCRVLLDFEGATWESVYSITSVAQMPLAVGDRLFALMRSSDLSIVEVL